MSDKRFLVVKSDGAIKRTMVIVDKETGVNYLFLQMDMQADLLRS